MRTSLLAIYNLPGYSIAIELWFASLNIMFYRQELLFNTKYYYIHIPYGYYRSLLSFQATVVDTESLDSSKFYGHGRLRYWNNSKSLYTFPYDFIRITITIMQAMMCTRFTKVAVAVNYMRFNLKFKITSSANMKRIQYSLYNIDFQSLTEL